MMMSNIPPTLTPPGDRSLRSLPSAVAGYVCVGPHGEHMGRTSALTNLVLLQDRQS